MSKRQASINTFFSKRPKLTEPPVDEENQNESNTPASVSPSTRSNLEDSVSPSTSTNNDLPPTGINCSVNNVASVSSTHHHLHPTDIDCLINNAAAVHDPSAFENISIPPPNFKFPGTTRQQTVRGVSTTYELKFQRKWFDDFDWLVYSQKDYAACKFCVFFAKNNRTYSKETLGALVCGSFKNWKRARELFRDHQVTSYHLNSVKDAERYSHALNNPELSIVNCIEKDRLVQAQQNRMRLKPIIETIIFCGR